MFVSAIVKKNKKQKTIIRALSVSLRRRQSKPPICPAARLISVSKKQIKDKYLMFMYIESSNTSCNRIIASLSGMVETSKNERHNDT